eukprot:scaffold263531_cov17-Tisochrysis_lutea.AAC.1
MGCGDVQSGGPLVCGSCFRQLAGNLLPPAAQGTPALLTHFDRHIWHVLFLFYPQADSVFTAAGSRSNTSCSSTLRSAF